MENISTDQKYFSLFSGIPGFEEFKWVFGHLFRHFATHDHRLDVLVWLTLAMAVPFTLLQKDTFASGRTFLHTPHVQHFFLIMSIVQAVPESHSYHELESD